MALGTGSIMLIGIWSLEGLLVGWWGARVKDAKEVVCELNQHQMRVKA